MKKFILFLCVFNILLCSMSGYAQTGLLGYGDTRRYSYPVYSRKTLRNGRSYTYARNIENENYIRVISFLSANDYTGLRAAQEEGLNIDAKNRQGDTAVCTAVKRNQYYWFSMLKSAGADTGADCMKKMGINHRKAFINEYIARGGSIPITVQESMLATSSSTDWLIVGGIAGGIVAVGGLTALALSGGGSSAKKESHSDGSSDGDWGDSGEAPKGTPVSYPKYPKTSDITNPEHYKTSEFGGSSFSLPVQNFLGQVNAQYAYAYAASQGRNVAGEGIIIGEIDSGVDYTHSQLSSQIAKDSYGNKLGLNNIYGPCRNGDTKNCWVLDSSGHFVKFYNDAEEVTVVSLDVEAWESYQSLFPSDYNWDECKNTPVVYANTSSHGTHVAGIMVAAKDNVGMHGVAYNAKLIGANMDFSWSMPNNEDVIFSSYKYLVDNNASVINNSWGLSLSMTTNPKTNKDYFNNYYKTSLSPAISYAAAHSVVSVFAAGNDENNSENYRKYAAIESAAPIAIPSLLYYRDSGGDLQPFSSYPDASHEVVSSLFITVVALNADNKIASYSNKCGSAAKWCIAAPGGDVDYLIASTYASELSESEWGGMGGTSQAAPIVTSSLAVLMAAYPSLTPQEAVAILFETATDLGNEDLYGHGLINLKAAMEPVGALSLSTGSTLSGVPLNGAHIIIPHSFNELANIPDKFMALDKYKRGFNLKTSNVIRSTSHSKQSFANDLRHFTKSANKQKVKLADNLNFAFSDRRSAFDTNVLSGKAFALTWHNEDNIELGFAFSSDGLKADTPYFEKELANPFVSAISDAYTLSSKVKLAKALDFSVSGTVGENNFFDGNELKEEKNDDMIRSMQAELNYKSFANVLVNLTGGILNEKSSMLGLSGYGAFETKCSDTYFVGVGVNTMPIAKTHLGFSYYRGYTKGRKQNAFVTISDLTSESFGFHLAYDITDELQTGFNVSSPLRVKKGFMALNLPISRSDTSDEVYHKQARAKLSPSSREWDYSVYAVKKIQSFTWQAMGSMRIHPDHIENARPDYRIMFSMSVNY